MSTPDARLVTKMTRLALRILATDTLRPTVTSAVMDLAVASVSSASPKLRRELIDCHLAALDWVLRDAFASQVPTPTFNVDAALERLEGMNVAQSYLEGYDRGKAEQAAATGAAMQATIKRILTIMTEDPANSKVQEAIENLLTEQNEQLIRAWAWGNESPSDDPNPYAVEKGDGTP